MEKLPPETILSKFVFDDWQTRHKPQNPWMIGVIEGEGIGPDVVASALKVLSAVETVSPHSFKIINSQNLGLDGNNKFKDPLTTELKEFLEGIFARGAILAGPGGGRFVYNLRRDFDLFCKLNLVRTGSRVLDAGRLKPRYADNLDIVIVRENSSGIYFGEESIHIGDGGEEYFQCSFSYSRPEVERILRVAAKIAATRREHLTVVTKEGGISLMSKLWRDCTIEVADRLGISYSIANIDYAAYYLVQHAGELDVVVAPNLFGDVLVDVSALLLGSRGLSYSGNFSAGGAAIYQTNHGAAFDLVGKDSANPVAQILSLAMMLRESFGLVKEASWIEMAVSRTWGQGYRTADIYEKSCTIIGTTEMTERIAENVITIARQQDNLCARPSY